MKKYRVNESEHFNLYSMHDKLKCIEIDMQEAPAHTYTDEQWDEVQERISEVEELMEKGYVAGRVKIGVTYYAVSDTTAEIYGIKPGICIVSINPDCDVANTDLAEGDIITEIDGKSTAGEVDIASLFSGKQAGDEVVCKVYRKTDSGDEKEFEIKFKLMADNGGLVTDSQAE